MPSVLGDSECRTIAWRAQTLSERIDVLDASEGFPSDEYLPDDGTPQDDESRSDDETHSDDRDGATAFLGEWRERLGDERLERRLSLDGLSEETCAACVRQGKWPEGEPLPDWVATADELVAAAEEWSESASRDPAFAGREYPFEDVLAPWVEYAHESLPVSLDRFSATATDSLREWLVRRLVEVTAEPLFVEFKAFAASRRESSPEADPEATADSREHYEAFVAEVASADGLRYLFGEYPVLARFAAQTVRQWTDAVAELDRRLRHDWDLLAEQFADGEQLERVGNLDVLTGDRHADGRAVFALRFDSPPFDSVRADAGTKVVYKPRSVGAEAFFDDVLADLNRRTDFDFRTVTCLERDGYGWMEWVAHDDCSSRDAVDRYYRRAGGLLCLAYALGFTDCHFENVVAAGEQPVIVDAETAMHPRLPREKLPGNGVLDEANFDSVLRTGLLPMDSANGDEYRIGGFTATQATARAARYDSACWRATNTDAVEYDPEVYAEERKRNVPTLDGDPETVADHRDAFEAGFREMYAHLADRGSELLADHEELAAMETRVLVAPTKLYASMVRAITSADCLSSGLDVTTKLDGSISTLLADETVADDLWRIHGWERAAVVRTDVPRFTARPDERRIRYRSETTGAFIEQSGYEAARRRLSNFESEDPSDQWDHVESALDSVFSE